MISHLRTPRRPYLLVSRASFESADTVDFHVAVVSRANTIAVVVDDSRCCAEGCTCALASSPVAFRADLAACLCVLVVYARWIEFVSGCAGTASKSECTVNFWYMTLLVTCDSLSTLTSDDRLCMRLILKIGTEVWRVASTLAVRSERPRAVAIARLVQLLWVRANLDRRAHLDASSITSLVACRARRRRRRRGWGNVVWRLRARLWQSLLFDASSCRGHYWITSEPSDEWLRRIHGDIVRDILYPLVLACLLFQTQSRSTNISGDTAEAIVSICQELSVVLKDEEIVYA